MVAHARKEAAFGAACFVLSPKAQPPFQLKGSEYLAQVAATLSLAQGISDIEATAAPYFESETFSVDSPLPLIEEGPTVFPPTDGDLWITFWVHIVDRVQKELLGKARPLPEEGSLPEDFFVTMTTGFHSPVAFVEPLDPPAGYDPSSAVMIVREYLKRELAAHPKAQLRFECLGPSPWHAEFRLKVFQQKTPIDVAPADWSWTSKYAGYDEIDVTYNPKAFLSLEDAEVTVHMALKEQLSVAYYAIQTRLELEEGWEQLQGQVTALADTHRARGFRNYLRRTFRVPKELIDATLALTDYELMELQSLRSVQSAYQSHYEHEDHPCVAKQVEEYVNEVKPLPVDQFKRLVELFDRHRAERFAGLNVLISAILGGIVGAVLTAVASRIAGH